MDALAGLSEDNRKSALDRFRLLQPHLPLNITPVGDPGVGWLGALGMVATSGRIAPPPVYTVEVPPALFETHQGVLGPWTSPQAF